MIRRRVVADGKVQGVYFRDSTRKRADELGVAGWVTNRADGGVEAVFEGPEQAVEEMVSFCGSGPGHAQVSSLDVSEEDPEGLAGFEIR